MNSLSLGVLLCDSVGESRLHIDGDYRAIFETLFRENSPPSVEVSLRFYDVTNGEYPTRFDECAGYLTNGAGASVSDDDPWIESFESFVRHLFENKIRLFAICFGHQMIAKALGGHVERSERGWGVGIHEVDVVAREPWMSPRASSFRVVKSHQDQVVTLPPGGVILASTLHCPVSMMRCGSLVGIQGHPEFSVPYARALLESRHDVIPEATRETAHVSFALEPDRSLLVSWMLQFFRAE